jgi:endonuclease YncB( thermonuclease family)
MNERLRAFPVFLLLFLLLACASSGGIPTPSDGERITVARVVDGDTVELADGRRVRYIGINTPERGQPLYEEATDANRRLVEGQAAWLALDVQPVDQYGRTLAYLWVGDRFVNLEMVRQGYANAYTAPPNVRYSEAFRAAEQQAREAEEGLWAQSDLKLRIRKVVYDAPGNDAENPNGEWVEIVNEGSQAADLAGCTLKDEGNHIYVFSAVSVGAGEMLRLRSGQGTDGGGNLFWGLAGDSVWSNDGDTAYLRDPQGRLVDSYGY